MIPGNLTKEEALIAMQKGHKVTREYFGKDEFIHMPFGSAIMSEEGYNFNDWWKNIEPTLKSSSNTPWRILKD